MKKMLLLLAVIFLVCAAFTVPSAFAEGQRDIRVFVNRKLVDFSDDVKPFINENNRTMVPIRFVSNELGASVDWDSDTKKVTISQADKIIELVIGNSFAHVNGEKQDFDTAAEILEDRTMVPLRFVNEALGATVDWVNETRTAYITTEAGEPQPPNVETVTLYFSDDQAQYLVKERREVTLTGQRLAEIIFNELQEGPRRQDLRSTIPEGTEFRLVMFENVAQLFLTSHFRDNHTGGSAAEQMTLYSIVNSLTELEEVDAVLFLLIDSTGSLIHTEAILGHINTEQALSPNPGLVQE